MQPDMFCIRWGFEQFIHGIAAIDHQEVPVDHCYGLDKEQSCASIELCPAFPPCRPRDARSERQPYRLQMCICSMGHRDSLFDADPDIRDPDPDRVAFLVVLGCHHRAVRCGFPEVIFCPGKTAEQVIAIAEKRLEAGGNLLATRADDELAERFCARFPAAEHHAQARTLVVRQHPARPSGGTIGIVTAGTGDGPVAEEARVTAEIMDQRTRTFYDMGVSGLHRLLAETPALQSVNVVVVAAGMDGALPSVVGGLVACPVIAVPTSIGYGANFGGVSALLTMLNSCSATVSVVNIDNGFGAGYIAAQINRLADAGGATPALRDEAKP